MSKRPVNLTLHERVLELAAAVMALRGHGSLSAFIEELIRDEYERRKGVLTLPPGAKTPSSAGKVAAKTVYQMMGTQERKGRARKQSQSPETDQK